MASLKVLHPRRQPAKLNSECCSRLESIKLNLVDCNTIPWLLRPYEGICEPRHEGTEHHAKGSITAPAIASTKQHVTCRVGDTDHTRGRRVFGRSAAGLRGSQEGGPRQCGEI